MSVSIFTNWQRSCVGVQGTAISKLRGISIATCHPSLFIFLVICVLNLKAYYWHVDFPLLGETGRLQEVAVNNLAFLENHFQIEYQKASVIHQTL